MDVGHKRYDSGAVDARAELRKRFYLIATVLPVVAVVITWAFPSAAVEHDRTVVVMFERGGCSLPVSVNECAVSLATFASSTIQNALVARDATVIARAVPTFVAADTFATSRLGAHYRRTDWSRVYFVELASQSSVAALVADLSGLDGIVYAEPGNVTRSLYVCPSNCVDDEDFRAGRQWNVQNCGQANPLSTYTPTVGADIDLIDAWSINPGSNVTVAIFDEGVDAEQEDLYGRVDGDLGYVGGHGTAVAGLVAAQGNNGHGIAGINWEARINSQIVIADDFLVRLADAVHDVLALQIPIVNMSYGGTFKTTEYLLLRDLYNASTLLVAASPYVFSPVDEGYPARYDIVTGVGASTPNDDRLPSSGIGDWVDLLAPGAELYSLEAGSPSGNWFSGTSAAAPHVAGVASLLLSENSALDNDDLRELILRSTDPMGDATEWTPEFGHGRLNARKALAYLRFPHELYQRSVTGGSSVGAVNVGTMRFIDVEGLSGRPYVAKRHEVRRSVSFPTVFAEVPEVWGRGAATAGFANANPNFGVGHCAVVTGSVTSSGATLKTFVYELFDVNGAAVGWAPTAPQNVKLSYTVVGQVSHGNRIDTYVMREGTSTLLPMPQAFANGCPLGDADSIVVEVCLDPADFPLPLFADDLTLDQPRGPGLVLYPECEGAVIADYSPTLVADPGFPSGYCYKTAFTIPYRGGCGIDSSEVRLFGGHLGYARMNGRSPDGITIGASTARVDLSDFSAFGAGSPPSPYSECSDFVIPFGQVGTNDFAYFGSHWAHAAPSTGGNMTTVPAVAAGAVSVEIAEENHVSSERILRVTVGVSNLAPYSAMVVVLRNENRRLEYVDWERGTECDANVLCAEVVRDGQKELFFGVTRNAKATCSTTELGSARFRVSGEAALDLSDADFELLAADVLGADGETRTARYSSTRTVSEARYSNELAQNYPNPFNPTTTLAFSIKDSWNVMLAIYDVAGRRVCELLNEPRKAGSYTVEWNGRNDAGTPVASGVYFYKLVAGEFTNTKKMIILK